MYSLPCGGDCSEKRNGSATRCVTYLLREGYSAAIKHTTRDGTVYEEAPGHDNVVRCLTVRLFLPIFKKRCNALQKILILSIKTTLQQIEFCFFLKTSHSKKIPNFTARDSSYDFFNLYTNLPKTINIVMITIPIAHPPTSSRNCCHLVSSFSTG